jgi:hypothetical protein
MPAHDSISDLKASQRKNALRTGWVLLSIAAFFFVAVMIKFAFFMR